MRDEESKNRKTQIRLPFRKSERKSDADEKFDLRAHQEVIAATQRLRYEWDALMLRHDQSAAEIAFNCLREARAVPAFERMLRDAFEREGGNVDATLDLVTLAVRFICSKHRGEPVFAEIVERVTQAERLGWSLRRLRSSFPAPAPSLGPGK